MSFGAETCPRCGEDLLPGQGLCPACGEDLWPAAPPSGAALAARAVTAWLLGVTALAALVCITVALVLCRGWWHTGV